MAFDVNTVTTTSPNGAFPGTGTPTTGQTDAALGVSAKLASMPVLTGIAVPGANRPAKFANYMGPVAGAPASEQIRYDEALDRINSYAGPELEVLQRQLYAARLFPASYYGKRRPDIPLGLLDNATMTAYTNLVKYAATSGKSMLQVLNDRTANNKNPPAPLDDSGTGTATSTPLTIRLTHPDDVASLANTAATKVLGRAASKAEIAGMTKAYHDQEVAAQTAQYNAQAGADTSTVTQAPDLTDFAENYLRANRPQDAQLNVIGGYIQQVLDMVQGKGGTTNG
jgi:hypothetical protein